MGGVKGTWNGPTVQVLLNNDVVIKMSESLTFFYSAPQYYGQMPARLDR